MHGRDRFGGHSSELDVELKRGAARADDEAAMAMAAAQGAPASEAWRRATPLMQSRFGERNFGRWLAPISVREDHRGVAIVAGDRDRARMLRQHFLPGIREALREVGFRGEVSLGDDAPPAAAAAPRDAGLEACRLDGRYTFEQFVVGESNRFAHDAARIVAERPGRDHNPLYLHGGVGLGKTHLATAVAHAVAAAHGSAAAVTLSADRFTSLGVAGRGAERLEEITGDSRLMVFDDVQLLTRDDDTLGELFRCLDALLARDCQVVLTCDLPPPAIPALSVGLKSRWERGFAAEILPPDLALRCEIVRRRALAAGTPIDGDAVEAIAAIEPSNVRALEGAFNRVRALAASTARPLTAVLVRESLAPRDTETSAPPGLDAVVAAVAAAFGIGARELRSRKRRDRDASLARQAALHLARRHCELPLTEIAADLGFRDHSAAAHACGALRERLERDAGLAARLRGIEERLLGSRSRGR